MKPTLTLVRHASLALALSTTALGSLGTLGMAGCGLSKEEGLVMQDEIAKLKSSQSTLTQQAADLRKSTEEADAQLKKMRDVLDEATKIVTRNSANLGQDVDKLKSDMGTVQGKVDDLGTQVGGLQKSFETFRASTDTNLEKLTNATTTAKSPPIPENADGVYAEAQKRFDAKQWLDARRLFDAFIARYSSDSRAATAQFQIAEAYFEEAKFANAIGAYSKVIDGYAKSDRVPDAMYKNGLAFYSLKYCGDAKIYFQELLRRYPKTTWKKDAGEQIKKIAKDQKNKDLCQQ
jgi:tol-pal system protein YbgF